MHSILVNSSNSTDVFNSILYGDQTAVLIQLMFVNSIMYGDQTTVLIQLMFVNCIISEWPSAITFPTKVLLS